MMKHQCVNCNGNHTSYSKICHVYLDLLKKLNNVSEWHYFSHPKSIPTPTDNNSNACIIVHNNLVSSSPPLISNATELNNDLSTRTPFNRIVPIPKGIIFAFVNICSIFNKMASIFSLLLQNHIDIFLFNETWLSSLIPNRMLYFPGYRMHRLDRDSHGGGLLFLVKNRFNSSIENGIMSEYLELLHVTLELPCTAPINIICIYRSPSCNINDFLLQLFNFLSNIEYSWLPLIY